MWLVYSIDGWLNVSAHNKAIIRPTGLPLRTSARISTGYQCHVILEVAWWWRCNWTGTWSHHIKYLMSTLIRHYLVYVIFTRSDGPKIPVYETACTKHDVYTLFTEIAKIKIHCDHTPNIFVTVIQTAFRRLVLSQWSGGRKKKLLIWVHEKKTARATDLLFHP